MKIFTINPLDKGYEVEVKISGDKERKKSGHNTRINAVNRCLREIPRDVPFQIVVLKDKDGN